MPLFPFFHLERREVRTKTNKHCNTQVLLGKLRIHRTKTWFRASEGVHSWLYSSAASSSRVSGKTVVSFSWTQTLATNDRREPMSLREDSGPLFLNSDIAYEWQEAANDAWARQTSITYSPPHWGGSSCSLPHLPDVTYFRQRSVTGGLCESDHSYCREDSYSERILDFRGVSFVQSFELLGGKCRQKAEPILNNTALLGIRPMLLLC